MSLDVYRAITYISGGMFGTTLLYFLITPLLVRFLGRGYGNYAFVMSLLAIMTLFFGSIGDSIQKFIAEQFDEQAWRGEVFGFSVRIAGFVGFIFLILLVGAVETGVVAHQLGRRFETYFYLLGLMILARAFFMTCRDVLIGIGFEHVSEAIYTLHRLLFGIFGISFAVFGFGVSGVLFGDVVATTVVMIAGLVLVGRRVQLRRVFSGTPESFPKREILRFSSQALVLGLLFQSLKHVDILILRPSVGAESTAHYKAALVVAEFVWVIPIALQHSLVHISSSMWERNQYEELDRLASQITRYILVLLLLLSIGLAVLAEPFLRLYFGAGYVHSVDPLLVLLPGVVGYAVSLPLVSIGKGKGSIRPLIYATGAGAVLNLTLNLLLIPPFGLMGAATATTIGYGSMILLHFWSSRRIGYDPLCDLRFGKICLTVLIAFPLIYALDGVIQHDVLALILVPPIGFVIYAGAAFWSGALGRSEVADILERVPVAVPQRVHRLFQD